MAERFSPLTRYCLLAALCLAAYAPSLRIPLLEDDYPNLAQSAEFGTVDAVGHLLADSVFRVRATSYWTMQCLWQVAGAKPVPYHLASLTLHIAAVYLVYLLAVAWEPMRPGALAAAAFFAVQEGHQEAVMWFSAINEPLMFCFGIGALICWLRVVQTARRIWHVPGVALFSLALLSKESAVILIPLFALTAPVRLWRNLVPYALLGAGAVGSILASRGNSFRFHDGSFSLAAPFWITLPHSLVRLLWIWGFAAILYLWLARKGRWRTIGLCLAWCAIGLVPYAFLTYSTAIPSRQTYLASAGLALLCGLAISELQGKMGRRTAAAILVVVLLENAGMLWTRKRRQFLLRAEPTEQLIATARRAPGPIWIACFPRPPIVAEDAVRLAVGPRAPRLVWQPPRPDTTPAPIRFCYIER